MPYTTAAVHARNVAILGASTKTSRKLRPLVKKTTIYTCDLQHPETFTFSRCKQKQTQFACNTKPRYAGQTLVTRRWLTPRRILE